MRSSHPVHRGRALALSLGFALVAFPAAARADDAPTADDALRTPPVTVPTLPAVARAHIASETPVRLESRAPGPSGTAWSAVCTAPCDRNLPLSDEYRIVSDASGAPGEAFRLDATASNTLTLTVHPRSRARQIVGTAMIGVGTTGAVFSLAGVITFATVAFRTPSGPACGPQENGHDPGISCGLGEGIAAILLVFSGVTLLASGGMIAGGAALLASSNEKTTQTPTFAREATWVGPRVADPARSAFVVPLSFSF